MASSSLLSAPIVIPANTSYYGILPLIGGNLLSVGLGNSGFTTRVYPTQLYIISNTSAFFQVDNQNDSPVSINISAVADNPAATFGPIKDQGSVPL